MGANYEKTRQAVIVKPSGVVRKVSLLNDISIGMKNNNTGILILWIR